MGSRIFVVVILTIGFSLLIIPVAGAYMDPGSGSFIVQMAIGAVLGASLAVKIFWRRLVNFFSGRRSAPEDEEQQSADR